MRPEFIEVDGTIIGLRHVVTVAFHASGSAVLQLTSGNVHVTEDRETVAGLKRYFLPQPQQEAAPRPVTIDEGGLQIPDPAELATATE